ncbi:MAG: 3-keto-disaccharide hydrolase, partial [Planctomycetota bacterium]
MCTRLHVALPALLLAAASALAADYPEWVKPPEDAVVLFDGSDTEKWGRGTRTDDGYLMAGATTREKFGDCLLHLEFNMLPGPGGKRVSGNSGVYIQRRYEIQILNSHGRKPYKGGCGAIYQTKPEDKNVTRPLGEWQSYTIAFRQPRWDDEGKKTENARISL